MMSQDVATVGALLSGRWQRGLSLLSVGSIGLRESRSRRLWVGLFFVHQLEMIKEKGGCTPEDEGRLGERSSVTT